MNDILDFVNASCKQLVEEDQTFGPKKSFVEFKVNEKLTGQDQFASSVLFGDILYEGDETAQHQISARASPVHVVIKLEHPTEFLREFFNSDVQFYNEILFYTKILPFLNKFQCKARNLFSTFYKGRSSLTLDGKVEGRCYAIFENACVYDDFRLAKSKYLLNLSHLLRTVADLGRFHGLSYIAKHANRCHLDNLINEIKETKYLEEQSEVNAIQKMYIVASIQRAIDKFENETKYSRQLARLKEILLKDPIRFAMDVVRPEEPMAVICHGDFCRNNIMYKYQSAEEIKTNAEDNPIDTLFFDMATIRYSSPVIDLSFFLYLNSNSHIQSLHWAAILEEYRKGIEDCVQAYADKYKVPIIHGKLAFPESASTDGDSGIFLPSLEDIHDEFKHRAMYGFLHCSFFLPIMMDDCKDAPLDKFDLPIEEQIARCSNSGGPEATEAVSNIVQHMFEMNFV